MIGTLERALREALNRFASAGLILILGAVAVPGRPATAQVSQRTSTSEIVGAPGLVKAAGRSGALRGHYRVTLTGFAVQNETADNPAPDGTKDEVFISTDVKILDTNGNQVTQGFDPSARSYVFGDVNLQNPERRKRAGSASDAGGIRTGDHYPDDPYSSTPPPDPHEIPIRLWEGTLIQGQNAVVLTPTIWEFDDSQNSPVFDGWVEWAHNVVPKLGASPPIVEMIGAAGAKASGLVPFTLDAALSFPSQTLGQSGDRPIGVNRSSRGTVTFQPQSLVLDYDNVESFLTQDHKIAGLPRGVYPLTYIDTGESGGGNYTLYLKIERS